ncbi:hypothetical protein PENTCL1PPCAC_28732, partial [Pristionchus entomophagus]
MLTRKLYLEWKEDKIRATSFCPGWVKTDMGTDAAMLTVSRTDFSLPNVTIVRGELRNYSWKNRLFLSPSLSCLSRPTMVSILVTGANRGIGLGLVRQLVQEPSVTPVIATARNIDKATDLKAIKSPKLHLVQLEMIDEQSIAQDVTKVSGIVGENGLDFLVNNAGIFNQAKLAGDLSKALVMEQFEVNTVAPLLLTNMFRGLLKKAADKKGSSHIANISSTLGSIEFAPQIETPMPIYAIYAISKAALNMLTRRLFLEWKEDKIRATSFCPGYVKTDMGTDAAMLTLEESTVPLAKLILSLTEEHNGLYYRYNGEKIP